MAVHEGGSRGDLVEEFLFRQLAQRQSHGPGRCSGGLWDCLIYRRHVREKLPQGCAPRAAKIFFALIQLRFVVQWGKQIAKLAHGLRGAQEEKTARVQRIVEQGHELLLQVAAHIDEQIAAADEVDFGEGGIFDDVVLGKDQHVAEAFVDAVGAAVGFGRKEPRQPFRRDVRGDAGRIEAGAGCGDCAAVDVGGEDLHPVILLEQLQALLQEDGDGIGLLAGGASRRPDADHGARTLSGKELGDDLFVEGFEGLRIAEKTGHADQQVAKQCLHLGRRLPKILDVFVDLFDVLDGHAPFDPPVEGARLVLGEVVAGLGAQQDEDLFQRILSVGADPVRWGGGRKWLKA